MAGLHVPARFFDLTQGGARPTFRARVKRGNDQCWNHADGPGLPAMLRKAIVAQSYHYKTAFLYIGLLEANLNERVHTQP